MGENETLPDHLRCKRTDGRRWRCTRRVMDDKKLCEIHHLQGQHRQYKRKVPESLKLQRKNRKLAANVESGTPNGEIRAQKEEKFSKLVKLAKPMKRKKPISGESNKAVKKMKLKGGDLQLELIRMVLEREIEKRKKKRKKKNKKQKVVEIKIVSGNENESSNSEGELMRDLPNGLMAISSPTKHFSNVVSTSSSPCDVKIGADFSTATRRCFRSKNIEPMPIGTFQVLPYKGEGVRLKKGNRKKCHWCRRSRKETLIRCSNCRKQFYCLDCIKEQYFDLQEEVKMACPVCRGTCGCKACLAIHCMDTECKDFSKDNGKVDKVLHFHYLICMLLPVLKQINEDQSVELEIEAKMKGQEPSELKIQHDEIGCKKQCCCNNCKTSIVDFHRSCPNCSYNLCLSCCWDIFQGSLSGSVRALICKCPNRRRARTFAKQHSEMISACTPRLSYSNKYSNSSTLLPWKVPGDNGDIPCPPMEFGGCGDSLLALSYALPLTWTRELETSAEEIVGCYELPEILDITSPCLLCLEMDHEVNGIKKLQEAARRENANDNLLYHPTIMDIRNDNNEHFQKHWGKGQPVIVRNVLQGTSDISWDPIVMFCTYLKNNAAKSESELSAGGMDWFEVEIGVRQLFMGSFGGPTHANMWHERLKLKGWLSSRLFQEHFPAHYAEILHALPVPEYMDPMSGVLNIAAELPQEFLKPDLGPYVYISYSSSENLEQADSVQKLRYDSYDVVNILVHTTDVPVSAEQLNYIRKLMKKHKEQNKVSGEAPKDEGGTEDVGLHSVVRKEVHLHEKVARISWFSATAQDEQVSSLKDRDMFNNGDSDSDSDTDTDTEVSKFFFGPVKSSKASENLKFHEKETEGSNHFRNKQISESCGAQWDVFRRQDVPKLAEYLRKHSNEFSHAYGFKKHIAHPILDQNFFLDATHKMRLKEEFKIEPWTFEQRVGEAVVIPAGCPYQIRNFKSCVNVVLDFVSPENVAECIHLIDELRLLPENHKAKADSLEVKKMALYSISRAIKEIRELTCAETSTEHDASCKD